MAAPVKTPVLQDVTTNKLYSAYKTQKGTIIQLNGLKTVIITGDAEKTGHSSGSFHGKDLAIDVAGKRFNKLTDEQARSAALKAGFTHGVYEDFRGTGRDHWHFQIGAGNGLSDKYKRSNNNLITKNY